MLFTFTQNTAGNLMTGILEKPVSLTEINKLAQDRGPTPFNNLVQSLLGLLDTPTSEQTETTDTPISTEPSETETVSSETAPDYPYFAMGGHYLPGLAPKNSILDGYRQWMTDVFLTSNTAFPLNILREQMDAGDLDYLFQQSPVETPPERPTVATLREVIPVVTQALAASAHKASTEKPSEATANTDVTPVLCQRHLNDVIKPRLILRYKLFLKRKHLPPLKTTTP